MTCTRGLVSVLIWAAYGLTACRASDPPAPGITEKPQLVTTAPSDAQSIDAPLTPGEETGAPVLLPATVPIPQAQPPPTLESVLQEAAEVSFAVALVECTGLQYSSIPPPHFVVTSVQFQVLEVFLGTPPSNIKVVGGEIGDVEVASSNTPRFEIAHEYIVFFASPNSPIVVLALPIHGTQVWVPTQIYEYHSLGTVRTKLAEMLGTAGQQ